MFHNIDNWLLGWADRLVLWAWDRWSIPQALLFRACYFTYCALIFRPTTSEIIVVVALMVLGAVLEVIIRRDKQAWLGFRYGCFFVRIVCGWSQLAFFAGDLWQHKYPGALADLISLVENYIIAAQTPTHPPGRKKPAPATALQPLGSSA